KSNVAGDTHFSVGLARVIDRLHDERLGIGVVLAFAPEFAFAGGEAPDDFIGRNRGRFPGNFGGRFYFRGFCRTGLLRMGKGRAKNGCSECDSAGTPEETAARVRESSAAGTSRGMQTHIVPV